jgi:hypothetical protein
MADPTGNKTSGDPRQQNSTSTGRGESATVGPRGSASNPSTSSGRSSDESDVPLFKPRADQIGKPLTMGSNGGGHDSEIEGDGREQSINTTEQSKKRKAS